jgi:hypothetical protein
MYWYNQAEWFRFEQFICSRVENFIKGRVNTGDPSGCTV